ncbi:hypothetical protein NM208_g12283 [Fusarium decemcellulare]|uniref:Uncharacterized protein n=1 Tax=Fusarium decemcellulare TaxID=57161 RepID=A0ACC1RPW5_9HYPO|nr:hypothetical protein NM208_g12283 [Fusarium decemcellulare]
MVYFNSTALPKWLRDGIRALEKKKGQLNGAFSTLSTWFNIASGGEVMQGIVYGNTQNNGTICYTPYMEIDDVANDSSGGYISKETASDEMVVDTPSQESTRRTGSEMDIDTPSHTTIRSAMSTTRCRKPGPNRMAKQVTGVGKTRRRRGGSRRTLLSTI